MPQVGSPSTSREGNTLHFEMPVNPQVIFSRILKSVVSGIVPSIFWTSAGLLVALLRINCGFKMVYQCLKWGGNFLHGWHPLGSSKCQYFFLWKRKLILHSGIQFRITAKLSNFWYVNLWDKYGLEGTDGWLWFWNQMGCDNSVRHEQLQLGN